MISSFSRSRRESVAATQHQTDHSRPSARSGPLLFYRPCSVSRRSPQDRRVSVSQHASNALTAEYDVSLAGGLESALLPHRNDHDQPCVTPIRSEARRKKNRGPL